MASIPTVINILVEHTGFGWAIGIDGKRHALFATRRQALDHVRGLRKNLILAGKASDLEIRGEENSTAAQAPVYQGWRPTKVR